MDQHTQLGLFDAFHQRYMEALDLLLGLRAADAEQAFRVYDREFPGIRDTAPERAACRILGDTFTALPDTEEALRAGAALWLILEKEFSRPPEWLPTLRKALFSRLADGFERLAAADRARFTDPAVPARWLLRAGRPQQAVRLIQSRLTFPPTAAACLGDCLYRLGQFRASRIQYREALAADHNAVAVSDVEDPEVRMFLTRLSADPVVSEPAPAWAASVGLIRGVFPFPQAGSLAPLASWQSELGRLRSRGLSPRTAARRFYLALLIAGQPIGHALKDGPDLANMRREMKSLAPELFAEYMEKLR